MALKVDQIIKLDKVYSAVMYLLETKDPGSFGHCWRVSKIAVAFLRYWGKSYGESETTLEMIFGLHDAGKIVMSRAMLQEGRELTEEEQILKRRHPGLSSELIPEDLELARQVAYFHHERYSGGGYPDGLIGKTIPEIARVACVVDSWDAMMGRPYKKKMSLRAIFQEFKKEQGRQFDPEILNAFRRFLYDPISGAEELLVQLYPGIFEKIRTGDAE